MRALRLPFNFMRDRATGRLKQRDKDMVSALTIEVQVQRREIEAMRAERKEISDILDAAGVPRVVRMATPLWAETEALPERVRLALAHNPTPTTGE